MKKFSKLGMLSVNFSVTAFFISRGCFIYLFILILYIFHPVLKLENLDNLIVNEYCLDIEIVMDVIHINDY